MVDYMNTYIILYKYNLNQGLVTDKILKYNLLTYLLNNRWLDKY